MAYQIKQTEYVSSKKYGESCKASKPASSSERRTVLGGLEMRHFREIEGWLFDCSSGK